MFRVSRIIWMAPYNIYKNKLKEFFFKLANSKFLRGDCNFKIAFKPILNMQKNLVQFQTAKKNFLSMHVIIILILQYKIK